MLKAVGEIMAHLFHINIMSMTETEKQCYTPNLLIKSMTCMAEL